MGLIRKIARQSDFRFVSSLSNKRMCNNQNTSSQQQKERKGKPTSVNHHSVTHPNEDSNNKLR